MSSSDSDNESVEEVQVKQYLISSLEGIKQAYTSLQKNAKPGIKRQPGHYHLRDRRHAVLPKNCSIYDGRHWEIEIPHHLQRSTPKLTQYAIRKAILKEQENIMQSNDRHFRAKAILDGLNREYGDVIVSSSGRIEMELERKQAEVEQAKDDVHGELIRITFCKHLDEDVEKERQHRIKVVSGLGDETKRTPSIEDLVVGMAETNYKRTLLNTDLAEAQNNIEKHETATNSEYEVAMSEMLDESLAKVIHTFASTETKQSTEEERIRRLKEVPENSNLTKEYKDMKVAMNELKNVFETVEAEEVKKEEKFKEMVEDTKVIVQEQLLRTVAKKLMDKAVAEERARRIHEAEQNAADPSKNVMRHMVTRVQRQMLLQKFKGKWINLTRKPKTEKQNETENETEHDKKLRQQRESQRRMLCVTKGDEDE